jgi:hypothetical protein
MGMRPFQGPRKNWENRMSDETNAKPADQASEPGEPQTPTGEPASAAHASEGLDKPFPGGQYTDPGTVYPVKSRTPVRVTVGRVIKTSAVQLVGAGLLGGLVGGGVVAIAGHDNGRDGRPAFSRQFQNQGTAQQQFPGRGQFQQDQQQGQQGQQGQLVRSNRNAMWSIASVNGSPPARPSSTSACGT